MSTQSHQSPLIDIPKSLKLLTFASSSFIFTLFLINRHRTSQYVLNLASDRALAGRALLLGTAAACSGVGVIMGLISTVVGANSFIEFKTKTDSFFIRHNIKRQIVEDQEDLDFEL